MTNAKTVEELQQETDAQWAQLCELDEEITEAKRIHVQPLIGQRTALSVKWNATNQQLEKAKMRAEILAEATNE